MATASTGRDKLDPTSADPAPPCVLVIFGAGGDLTKRLLMPALYNLAVARLLDERFAVLGINHRELSEDDFRDGLTQRYSRLRRRQAAEILDRSARRRGLRLAAPAIVLSRGRLRRPEDLSASSRSTG